MKKLAMAAGLALGIASGSALAQGFNQDNLYAGAGISLNSLSGFDDAVGFQIFGGYKLDTLNLDPVKLAVEVGYMDSGDFEANYWFGKVEANVSGVWASAVASYPLTPELNLLGRLGLDFGDDDGLLLGAGVGYTVSKEIELRAEYVIRDNVDSLQANFVYHF
ncbi:MAG TPA: outer membrane beta-barrel protein [Gammaproteobacteria bacterium]|nr:outer membrane beta-barrel protein [Gammaproteobacteria bacterium]